MSKPKTLWGALSEMETDIADIKRWGRVLIAMGCSENHIHPGAAFVLGEALETLGKSIETRWSSALDLARIVERGR